MCCDMREQGVADEFIIGPEFEFYVFSHIAYENLPQRAFFEIDSHQANWNMGDNSGQNLGYKTPHHGGYHVTAPWDITRDLRNEMCLCLEKLGVPVKYHHHEVGAAGQLEIEIEFGPMQKPRVGLNFYQLPLLTNIDRKKQEFTIICRICFR
ncbi:L-glutamine synthetase GlnA [Thermacetogenium phaeum DSM 12270]|uniref:L-glutamine synthetase GlnA n=2 Tax=Thermacetogenium phaeum TaxID=85874 RepID=K4LGJ3_THEPS|nr:L-glutamine synthetase GlnA [Thermacetogenium phaeum DSM 12270]